MSNKNDYPGGLKNGSSGEYVKVLQSLLQSFGFYAGQRIDGLFGPKTEDALQYFQTTHRAVNGDNLKVTGILDKQTWETLNKPAVATGKLPSVAIIPEGLNPERQAFLESWVKDFQKGVVEKPKGSNWGGEVSKYLAGIGPAYWCCFCAVWHFFNVTGRWPLGNRFGLVLAMWNEAKKKKVAFEKGTRMPLPGDLFVLLYRNSAGKLTGTGHIGVVTSVSPDGKKFNTLAGNEDDSLRFGYRKFSESNLVGFISLFPEEGCQPKRLFLTSGESSGLATR